MSTHSRMGAPPPPLHAENKLLNAARPTVTLLVEGHIDRRFWRTRTDPRHCTVRVCHGRPKALAELDRAARDAETRFLAVLDADFDRLEGGLVERDDVVWTDAHDLETTLLQSPVLEKLLRAMVGDAIEPAEARWAMTFRARLRDHAIGMGRLRWFTRRESLPLVYRKASGRDLKPFDKYARCVGDDWSPDLPKVVAEIINYSAQPALTGRDLAGACAALPAVDPQQLCNGHDLLGFLKVGLLRVAAAGDKKKIKAMADLDDRLADAYDHAWLQQTGMWRDLAAWEADNRPFRVFPR